MAPGGTMDLFEVVSPQGGSRRLKHDPVPDAALRQIMDADICASRGGNRQGWSFLVVRDAAKRAPRRAGPRGVRRAPEDAVLP